MNKHTRMRIVGVGLAAAALCSFGSAAYASPTDPGSVGGVSQEASNPALVNPDATVQLNINKYLGTATGQANDGTAQSVTLPTIQGVKFNVFQVFYDAGRTRAVDLTTNSGMQDAGAISGHTLTPAEVAAGSFTVNGTTYYLGSGTQVTTGADGVATFTKADGQGLYVVSEQVAPAYDVVADGKTVSSSTLSPSSPFLVMLPMTNPDTLNSWMYDVYVYPKNQADTIVKTVADKGTQFGGTGDHQVAYTLETSITDGMTAAQMATYRITDQLDSRLAFGSATVVLDGDGDAGTTGDRTALVQGTDYTLSSTGGKVVIDMTSAGLTKLAQANTANAAASVFTTLNATTTGAIGDGSLENQASFIPNQSWLDNNPGSAGTPSNEITSQFGAIQVHKTAANTGNVLSGAGFTVYDDPNNDGTCATDELTSANVLYPEATTGADGNVTFTGLQLSNFYNGVTQTGLQYYCLVETTAPDGYNLNPEPVAFTVTNAGTTDVKSITVVNELANLGNSLPFTGGQGLASLSIGGALLILGGLGYYASSSRRRDEEQDATA